MKKLFVVVVVAVLSGCSIATYLTKDFNEMTDSELCDVYRAAMVNDSRSIVYDLANYIDDYGSVRVKECKRKTDFMRSNSVAP